MNTEATIDSINVLLKSGFEGFHLRAKDGLANTYEVIRPDGTVAEKLSEGERNFIAFLYYYHLVKGSLSSEAVKDKIVVIDDPVSSMDSGALFIVSALVREMLLRFVTTSTNYRSHKVDGDYIKQIFVRLTMFISIRKLHITKQRVPQRFILYDSQGRKHLFR